MSPNYTVDLKIRRTSVKASFCDVKKKMKIKDNSCLNFSYFCFKIVNCKLELKTVTTILGGKKGKIKIHNNLLE